MFTLEIRRKRQAWRVIKKNELVDNLAVQALAYDHGGPGYPLFRITGPSGLVYESHLDGTRYKNDPAFARIETLVKRLRNEA